MGRAAQGKVILSTLPDFRTALVAVVFLDCTACLDKDRVEGGRFAPSEEGMGEGGSAHVGLV